MNNNEDNGIIKNKGDGQVFGTHTDYDFHKDVMEEPASKLGTIHYTNDGYVIIDGEIKMTKETYRNICQYKKEKYKNKNSQ